MQKSSTLLFHNKHTFFIVKTFVFLSFLFLGTHSSAQETVSSIINSTGSSSSKGNINFEWSVGESVLITTTTNVNITLTQGLLQGFAAAKPTIGDVFVFQASEVKVYPNPVTSYFNLDVLTTLKGVMEWILTDNKGSYLKSGKFNYFGEGKSEKVDMTGLAAGTYFLRVSIIRFGNGFTKPMREVGLKIIKLNQ